MSASPLPISASPPRDRTIVLVGLMGVGKSSIGRRLAAELGLPFRDADEEIELAAGRSVSEIFAQLGEPEFRAGERRVIARLLDDPPHVLATGGGAFVNPETRALVLSKAVVVWLKTDLDILARRVARKSIRPLLIGKDPLEVLTAHAEARFPAYAEAQIHIDTGDSAHGAAVQAVIKALEAHAANAEGGQ